MEYIALKGHNNGIDTTVITDIAEWYKKMGIRFADNYPFVGKSFNVTRAGIHADGVLKNPEIYTIFNTEKILKIPIGIGITDKSGVAGIALWINSYFSLPENKKVDKHHPGVLQIHKWVTEEYEARKRIAAVSDLELEYQTKKYIPELFESEFDELKNKVEFSTKTLIEKVASQDIIRSMKIDEMEKSLKKVSQEFPFIQLITVVNTEGQRVTHNITQIKDKFKYKTLSTTDFSDREWFIKAIETGKTFISDFYVSKFTDILSITVATPIFDLEEKELLGVIEFDIRFEDAVKL